MPALEGIIWEAETPGLPREPTVMVVVRTQLALPLCSLSPVSLSFLPFQILVFAEAERWGLLDPFNLWRLQLQASEPQVEAFLSLPPLHSLAILAPPPSHPVTLQVTEGHLG